MSARPSTRRFRPLALLAGGLLAPALLTGCGIRPTEVPVDAGAPASRTACPSELLAPRAPGTPAPAATPGAAPTRPPAPTAAASVSASPAEAFVAPSPAPDHCT
ncbi:hypothetical protein Kpho02_66580 [Kitasatospora phosalacinea]|uniref:Uncharacterized protein n=1 Tax=Kitasatospora phosalacinea TaxID=2065 RepID=A0A9W6V6N5_9ACTN|nr:hypothetical protein [Kitasatospora phosalacinea]GLW74360.1 hypothetical protein Kpho02_66580 [Kitasatospora phosalacinea]